MSWNDLIFSASDMETQFASSARDEKRQNDPGNAS